MSNHFLSAAIGPVTVTADHGVFRESMENITAFGGGDCPEVTVAAVKKALQLSLPNSYIYVFTDASAKDYRLQNEVLSMIQRKKSQVRNYLVLKNVFHWRGKSFGESLF